MGVAGTLLVVVVAAACVRLGIWQLHRLQEKRAHNTALESRFAAPPIVLQGAVYDTTGLVFRRTEVTGTFDNDRTIIFPGHSHDGMPGVQALTPLRLVDGGAVLVNRGWVPSADAATVDLAAIREEAPVRLIGIVLPFPGSTGASAPVPTTESTGADSGSAFRHVWFSVQGDALRRQFPYPLLAVLVQALPGQETARYPLRLPPPRLDEGPHLGYAIQWFSFAIIAIVGWVALVLKGRDERRMQAAPVTGND